MSYIADDRVQHLEEFLYIKKKMFFLSVYMHIFEI